MPSHQPYLGCLLAATEHCLARRSVTAEGESPLAPGDRLHQAARGPLLTRREVLVEDFNGGTFGLVLLLVVEKIRLPCLAGQRHFAHLMNRVLVMMSFERRRRSVVNQVVAD